MSEYWNLMTQEERLQAVTDYVRDKDTSVNDVVTLLAERLKMRPVFVKSQGETFWVKQLEKTATSRNTPWNPMLFLRSWFFARHLDVMKAFLDAVGVAHDNCQIQEQATAPTVDACGIGVAKLTEAGIDSRLARIYLLALVEQDPEFWKGLEGHLKA